MQFENTTSLIIGSAIKVHKHFGPGFAESVYQRSLVIEMEKVGLECCAEVSQSIYYGDVFVGLRRIDILVNKQILCELKAVSELDKGCYTQVLNCLKVFSLQVGLLINFGQERLYVKRFVNNRF